MFLFTLRRHLRVQSTRKHFAFIVPVIVMIRTKQCDSCVTFFTVTPVSDVFQFAFAQLHANISGEFYELKSFVATIFAGFLLRHASTNSNYPWVSEDES